MNRRGFLGAAFLLVASRALPEWSWDFFKRQEVAGEIWTPPPVITEFDSFFVETMKRYEAVLVKNFVEYRPAVAYFYQMGELS